MVLEFLKLLHLFMWNYLFEFRGIHLSVSHTNAATKVKFISLNKLVGDSLSLCERGPSLS